MLRRIVPLFLVLSLLLSGCGALRNNSRSYRQEQEVKYFIDQMVPFDNDELPLSDTAQLYTYDMLLVGEIPGVRGNASIQWLLLKNYHEQAGVTYMILDAPASGAHLLNEWIHNGNRTWLDAYYAGMQGTPKDTEEDYGLWLKVREGILDGTLPADLEVVGIDFETSLPMALQQLNRLTGDGYEAQDPALMDLLKAARNEYYDEVFVRLKVKEALANFKSSTSADRQTLGSDSKSVLHILDGIAAALEASDEKDDLAYNKLRSNFMTKTLNAHVQAHEGERYFGQINSLFTMQSEHMGNKWLAAALLEENKLNMLTVLLSYEECERLVRVQSVPDKLKLDLFAFDDKGVLNALGKPFTLIEINKEDSPFREENIIFESDFEQPPTEYFQYLIVLNRMSAETPLLNPEAE